MTAKEEHDTKKLLKRINKVFKKPTLVEFANAYGKKPQSINSFIKRMGEGEVLKEDTITRLNKAIDIIEARDDNH